MFRSNLELLTSILELPQRRSVRTRKQVWQTVHCLVEQFSRVVVQVRQPHLRVHGKFLAITRFAHKRWIEAFHRAEQDRYVLL